LTSFLAPCLFAWRSSILLFVVLFFIENLKRCVTRKTVKEQQGKKFGPAKKNNLEEYESI
jgi:hypothetical protein